MLRSQQGPTVVPVRTLIGTLTLSTTEIQNGTVNGAGTIDVTGDSKIDATSAASPVQLTTKNVTVDAAKLTLDDVTAAVTPIPEQPARSKAEV